MAAGAVFIAPNGQPAAAAIRAELQALTAPSVGDLLYAGQIFRARIRERTFAGVDVNGAPFAPYSTKGPYYLYVNRDSAGGNRQARATAAKNRHEKTGRIGARTATGIRYESYAAAKAAHGVSGVNLYGMEQHPHMLDAIVVKAGGSESTQSDAEFYSGGDAVSSALEQNQECTALAIGFYDDTAERARGHNEGTSRLPKREFFALNEQDLDLAAKAIAQRMMLRAKAGRSGFAGGTQSVASIETGPITDADIGF